MSELVLRADTLPEPLFRMVHTDRVRVRELNRVITIEPIEEREYDCPLFGAAVGSKLTVERFLEMTREEREDGTW